MSQFFETIRFENGEFYLLDLHQKRIERTFESIYGQKPIVDLTKLSFQTPQSNGSFRCRISYDETNYEVKFFPYQLAKPKIIAFYEAMSYDYHFKSEDRVFLNEAVLASESDDVIFTKNGFLTDSSYANLAFFDGQNWYTPSTYLLRGVKRDHLIAEKKIKEMPLHIGDLVHFQEIALINAMRDLSSSCYFEYNDSKLILTYTT